MCSFVLGRGRERGMVSCQSKNASVCIGWGTWMEPEGVWIMWYDGSEVSVLSPGGGGKGKAKQTGILYCLHCLNRSPRYSGALPWHGHDGLESWMDRLELSELYLSVLVEKMAASSSRTIVHYTPNKITRLRSSTQEQLGVLRHSGKPMGFWYAYGTNWRNLIEAGRAGQKRNTKNIGYRYDVPIPEEAFVTDVASITPNVILELSASNLDDFMERFHRDEYQPKLSIEETINAALERWAQEGDSHVLQEMAKKDSTDTFDAFLDEMREAMDTNDNNERIDLEGLIEITHDRYYELFMENPPSEAARIADDIGTYDWVSFWDGVSSSVGGVEFHEDLFTITEWKGISLTWTDKLDIHSGVIFDPATFRDGVLKEYILQMDPVPAKGGRRGRTRRGRGRKGGRKTRQGGRR